MFTGHCDKTLFERYLADILVPCLQKKMVVIIDNASFHKSQTITRLIEDAGATLMYLPPYSPDLNPIEHSWHQIKTAIRKIMRDMKMILEDAMAFVLKKMSLA